MRFKKLTKQQEATIRDNYLKMSINELARQMNLSDGLINRRLKLWGLVIPEEVKNKHRQKGKFLQGHKPFNLGKKQNEYMTSEGIEKVRKTQFKKGIIPHNSNYNGHERFTKDGYIEVRISPANYRLKHLHEWEKINGNIPKGHCLWCIDGNKQNTSINNWRLISRAENMYNNSHLNNPKEIIPTLLLINKLNKKIQNGTK